MKCTCVGALSASANVSAISLTHINDTALTTTNRDTSACSVAARQSTDVIGRQRQLIADLDSVDLTASTREPFLDGCRVCCDTDIFCRSFSGIVDIM